MATDIEAAPPAATRGYEKPSAFIRWSARVLCWLCWLIIAMAVFTSAMNFLDIDLSIGLSPRGATASTRPLTEGGAATTLISFVVKFSDAANNTDEVWRNLRADWLNRILGLSSNALSIWALLSARRSFVGVGRGEYFSRGTILGLRNLSLAVLLYHTVAPIVEVIPRVLYYNSIKNGRFIEFSMSLALNEAIVLVLISAAVVALVSTVMAHAAKIADENRQFV